MKKLIGWLSALLVFLIPVTAFAQDAEVPEGFEGIVMGLVGAAKGGEWSIFASLIIMLLVYLVTKVKFIKSWLPKEAKPWVAAVAGVLGAISATVLTTGNWLTALVNGLVTGAAASGLWSLIGKKLLPGDKEEEDGDKEQEGR